MQHNAVHHRIVDRVGSVGAMVVGDRDPAPELACEVPGPGLHRHGWRGGHDNSSHGRNQAMLIAEANVQTERSGRYLVQLCQHIDKAGRAHPHLRAQVEWSDDRGVISLDRGRCTLRALPGALTLRPEAPDEDTLHRLEQRIAGRLQRIGRRDHLTVTWTPPLTEGEQPIETPIEATADTRGDAGD